MYQLLVIRLVGVGSSVLLFRWRGTISTYMYNLGLGFSLTTEDYNSYFKLKKIEEAYISSKEFLVSINGQSGVALKKSLGGLSCEVDYIFKKLDEVRGGEFIKTIKKELSQKVTDMAADIDIRLTALKNEDTAVNS